MLNERRKHLLHLRSSWITTFASATRYDSHISTADNIVASLINGSVASPANFLIWRPQTSDSSICASVLLEEAPQEQTESWNEVSTTIIADPEEVIIQDILLDGDDEARETDNSGEVEVILPEIAFFSLCPVS
jgi:hypothetical protein